MTRGTGNQDEHQGRLPFAEAEGAYAERRALLWVALQRCQAGPTLRRLCGWLFEITAGGAGEPVSATHRELAGTPWAMDCSVSTLKRAVREGARAGLIRVEEVWDAHRRNLANRYSLDLKRMRAVIRQEFGRGAAAAPAAKPKAELVAVQNEPLAVQFPEESEPLGVQNEPLKRGADTDGEGPGGVSSGGREAVRACLRALTHGDAGSALPMDARDGDLNQEKETHNSSPHQESKINQSQSQPSLVLQDGAVAARPTAVALERVESVHGRPMDAARDGAVAMAEVLPAAIQAAADRYEESCSPLALAQKIRRRVAEVVPGLTPDVLGRLADAVAFGRDGHRLEEEAVDAALASFRRQLAAAEQGKRRPIRNRPGLFCVILDDLLPKAPWHYDWCPNGKRRQRE